MYRCVFMILLIVGVFTGFSIADEASDIAQKIEGLGDPDPAVRSKCFDELKAMGDRIRPQLDEASRSTNPAVSDAAVSLLTKMPWYVKEDSPKAKTLLGKYGELADEEKEGILLTLLDSTNPKDIQTLLRVMTKEPNQNMVWTLANSSTLVFNPTFRKYVLDNNPDKLSLPLKNAFAKTLYSIDYPRSIAILTDVVKTAQANEAGAEFSEIPIAWLVKESIEARNWTDAMHYQRLQSKWSGDTQATATVLFMQANHGPLAGLGRDIQPIQHKADYYAFGVLLGRLGCNLPAQIILNNAVNIETQDTPVAERGDMDIARFLLTQQQPNLAMRELDHVIFPDGDIDISYLRFSCLYGAGNYAEAADVMDKVAEHLQSPLRFTLDDGGMIVMNKEDCHAKAQWLRVQHARDHQTPADEEKALTKLLELAPSFDEITIDLVAYLDEHKRAADADDVLNRTVERSLEALGNPQNTPRQLTLAHNNLAWLCARCNRKLDLALKHAEQAVKEEPNGAFLDTLAEVHFRLGNFDKAIEIETRALQLSPREPTLPEQLARFKAAAAAKKAGDSTTTP